MRPVDAAGAYRSLANPAHAWRWVLECVWKVEHAFERSKAAGKATDDTRIRIFFVLVIFSLAFATLAFEAGRAALFSKAGGVGLGEPVPAEARADLVDRQGRLLAADLTHYGLYLDPREIWDQGETRRALLAALPNLSKDRLRRALASSRREYLLGGLTPQQRARVHDLGLPGVVFEEEARRVYPLGPAASHLIGFSDVGGHGLAGVERAMDRQVRDGARTSTPMALSIDLRVQAALEDELNKGFALYQARGAVGIVTDVHTGEILALASLPDYDPNAPGRATPDQLMNRAGASVYEMGSTFKIFTSALALDAGVVTPGTTFDATQPLRIGSRVVHDYHAENRVMTVEDIFIHSSNIGTARMALMAGAPRMTQYFRGFGLLSPAQVELFESAKPILPREWNQTTVASASFGAAIAVSPLAVAAGVGSIMNGGEYVPLTITKLQPGQKLAKHRVVSPETSRAMLDLMRANVIRGSGGKADAAGLRVGGKTGSAEKPGVGGYQRDKLVSSFAAVFPTDGALEAPRYMVLVIYDEPKGIPQTYGFATGGWNATPTVGKVIDRIAPFLGVRRISATAFGAAKTAAVPVHDEPSGGQL